jgi:hypothetical protein
LPIQKVYGKKPLYGFCYHFCLGLGKVQAQDIPAGCADGPSGPPSAGTVCPDGSIPLGDPELPLGCPGSTKTGTMGNDYSVICPARPGRGECEYSKETNRCVELFRVTPVGSCGDTTGSCITDNIQKLINILSIGIGVIITIVIIFAGFQYMTARDNPQAVQGAKSKILNAIIALVAYIFLYAFLQWVVPGGVF